ncbi:MAG TPA: polysaccharide biosynthesis C-terminal domain-containing protein [Flavobacteriales bacterium]|nr:polysaccharide biosynthesis C-terminal domain-containing protein [Flavobacteriales bacterium]
MAIAAGTLFVSVLAGHHLGLNGLGVIGLVVLAISLNVLAANLLGGGALVYLVPRVPLARLIAPSYAWAVAMCGLGYLLIAGFDLVPPGYAVHVAVLSLIQAVYGIHLNVLIGQGRIRAHNMITMMQALVLLAVFAALLFTGHRDPMAYVWATYAAFFTTLLASTACLRAEPPRLSPPEGSVFNLLLRQGAFVQSANAMQLLNYRASFWIIERLRGTDLLGLYSLATQLSESAWLAPKSLGLILYSRVSNSADANEQRHLTLTLLKAAVGSAAAVVLVLLLLPGAVFSWAFGKEVTGLFPVMIMLAPGILAMAASQAFSHFYSGTGRNRHNVIGSGIGLAVTLVAGYLLIARWGLVGAAATASLAYGLNALYQTVVFLRVTGTHWRALLPGRSDVIRLRNAFQRLR